MHLHSMAGVVSDMLCPLTPTERPAFVMQDLASGTSVRRQVVTRANRVGAPAHDEWMLMETDSRRLDPQSADISEFIYYDSQRVCYML